MVIRQLNEKASFELVEPEKSCVRMQYSNRFYGQCTLVARLQKSQTGLISIREPVSVERYKTRHGDLETLLKVAKDFVKQAVVKNPDFIAVPNLVTTVDRSLLSGPVAGKLSRQLLRFSGLLIASLGSK
jgi:hypothetical protein